MKTDNIKQAIEGLTAYMEAVSKAVRMKADGKITVLINPWENKQKEKTIKGVFLTRNYENPSGVLPEEHLFVSDAEDWFYWLGYNKYWMRKVTDQEVHNIKKVINYVSEFADGAG